MINKTSLSLIFESIANGNCCRVLGPRFHAKSKLMREAEEALYKSGGYCTSYQSLLDLKYDDVANFYHGLYSGIERDVLQNRGDYSFAMPISAFEFQLAVLELIKKCDKNLVFFIDDLEIAPPNLVASLLGALRAIFTMTVDQPGARFQAVVCGSMSLHEVALESASRFESISDLVMVSDLGEGECTDYLDEQWRSAGFVPTKRGLKYFYNQTGGDIFLVKTLSRYCVDRMAATGKKRVTISRVKEAIEKYLKDTPDPRVKETIQQISNIADLLLSTLSIHETGEALCSELPIDIDQTPSALDLCGVFIRQGERYRIKGALWANILEKSLTPQYVGRQFSIVGYWDESIQYFGKAILDGHMDVISEIMVTVINAINSINSRSPNRIVDQAYRYIALGIKAAYPKSKLRLYHILDQYLDLSYPSDEQNGQPRFELSDRKIPEVAALSGPKYSYASTSIGTCYLIPLRTDRNTLPIGLVVFRDLRKHASPHYQREAIVQMSGFLTQVAQTIDRKLRFADLLQKLDREAEIREKTAKIATGLVHDIYSAVANIPDLVSESEQLIQDGKNPLPPLTDLRNLAFETDRVSKKLKDFVVTGDFKTRWVNLESLIKRSIASYRKRNQDAKIPYAMNGVLTDVNVDDLWIELLLVNLLSNAFDAIPKDRSEQVSVEVGKTQTHLFIQVLDNGIGIMPEMISKIFDFGISTKKDHQMRGIGLYQCKQIAEAHHGALSVESEPGVGSIFTLKLPLSLSLLYVP